jgi:hypothetical protein
MSAADARMRRMEYNIGGARRSLLDDVGERQMDQRILTATPQPGHMHGRKEEVMVQRKMPRPLIF